MRLIVFLLVITALSGCRSRQAQKSTANRDSTSTSKVVVRQANDVKTDVETQSRSEATANVSVSESDTETIVEPIDPSKPATYTDPNGKKLILDNARATRRTKTKSSSAQTAEKASETNTTSVYDQSREDRDSTGTTQVFTSETSKKVDAKPSTIAIVSWWIWLLLVMLIIALVWRFRKDIPILKNFL